MDRFVKQLDGCTYCSGGLNCTCACHAMWLYRASGGKIKLSACSVRRATGDRVEGTNLDQMREIAASHGIAGRLWKPGDFSELRRLVLTGRYAAHVNIGYNVLANTDWDCFGGGFRGAHDLFVRGGTANDANIGDPGADGRRPTIPNGWQEIPWDLLERAASALPLNENGKTLAKEYGSGKVFTLITPPDPVTVSTRWAVTITSYTPLYTLPNGRPAGAVSRATYLCNRPPKVRNEWWYKILSKVDGSYTDNRNHYFQPHTGVVAHIHS